MFCDKEKEIIKELENEVSSLKGKISALKEEKKDAEYEHSFKLREIKFELKNAKEEAVKDIQIELNKEKTKRKIAESTVTQLENAFETMGFDVKQIGEMMNKLVDGLSKAKSSKIEIHK